MKRLRKRTIGGVKTSGNTSSKLLPKARSHLISYIKTPNPTPTTSRSRMDDFMNYVRSPFRTYVPMHLTSFLGEDEQKLKEDFLEFVKNFGGEVAIRFTRPKKGVVVVDRRLLTVTYQERTSTLTPETIGNFVNAVLKTQRRLYNASFIFQNYTFQFSGSTPIPEEIASFLRRFGVYTI